MSATAHPTPARAATRSPWPDVATGAVVFGVGLIEIANNRVFGSTASLVVVVSGTALAVGVSRRSPGTSLAVVWITGLLQVFLGAPLLLVQLSLTVVSFATTRWGRVSTIVWSGLSIPAASLLTFLLIAEGRYFTLLDNESVREGLRRLTDDAGRIGAVATLVLGVLALLVPWVAGLALRFAANAQRSRVGQEAAEVETAVAYQEVAQAREIADLREQQARLARDVHDVVGHSLAVILAQAESAQFIPDEDPERLKQTMANIAGSARSSLHDVRNVLSQAPESDAAPGSLDELVEGVRSGGHHVVSSVVGVPQPLPPELEVVAYRLLQEMLTNAIKHGSREAPVSVERHWEGDLRMEVDNQTNGEAVNSQGSGIEGMRRRVEAVGGRLDVRRRERDGVGTHTVTAWVPVRPR